MDNKFPARVVIILTLCTTLNCYTLVNLFPYVGLMVKDLLGLETTNELGYYAGYVASAFTFGRFVASYPLGYMTDSIGRKPVIAGGLLSIMVFSLAFGLSPTFGFAVSSRLLLGLTNGIMLALRTTAREICGDEHVFEGMTYLAGGKGVSLVVGTGIGGLLAQPAVNYPSLFSASGVFGKYPFLLPNLVGSIAALLLLPAVLIYIPETKYFEERRAGNMLGRCEQTSAAEEAVPEEAPGIRASSERSFVADKVSSADQPGIDGNEGRGQTQQTLGSPDLEVQDMNVSKSEGTDSTDRDCDADDNVTNDQEQPGVWGPHGLIAVPGVRMVLFLCFVTQALVIGFEEVFPLWALSTPDVGGLAWGTVEIGKVMLAAGTIMVVLQLVVFPRVLKVLKFTICQRIGCILAVPAFVAVPYAESLSWNDRSLFVVSVASTSLVYCSTAVINVALTVASTTMVSSERRGKLAGLFNMSGSLGRTLGPVGSATLFAWSISPSSYDWVGHEFVFVVAGLSMSLAAILAWGSITDENMMISA